MQTFYIDVYFLINFTVDFLALYFSSIFSKVPTSPVRLILASLFGALSASGMIFIPDIPILQISLAIITLIICAYIASVPVGIRRRIRFVFAFLIFEALFGAGVGFLWDTFDKFLYESLAGADTTPVNRKLLLFSVVILISIGVFKMIVSFFSNIVGEGSVEIEIKLFGKKIKTEAFIDSGNLAVDPMDMQPILFVKEGFAREFIPEGIIELRDLDLLDRNTRKKIRLIPISRGGVTHVLTGIKADEVSIVCGEEKEKIAVTVAIDKEEGTYGGYRTLIPSGVVNNVKI